MCLRKWGPWFILCWDGSIFQNSHSIYLESSDTLRYCDGKILHPPASKRIPPRSRLSQAKQNWCKTWNLEFGPSFKMRKVDVWWWQKWFAVFRKLLLNLIRKAATLVSCNVRIEIREKISRILTDVRCLPLHCLKSGPVSPSSFVLWITKGSMFFSGTLLKNRFLSDQLQFNFLPNLATWREFLHFEIQFHLRHWKELHVHVQKLYMTLSVHCAVFMFILDLNQIRERCSMWCYKLLVGAINNFLLLSWKVVAFLTHCHVFGAIAG